MQRHFCDSHCLSTFIIVSLVSFSVLFLVCMSTQLRSHIYTRAIVNYYNLFLMPSVSLLAWGCGHGDPQSGSWDFRGPSSVATGIVQFPMRWFRNRFTSQTLADIDTRKTCISKEIINGVTYLHRRRRPCVLRCSCIDSTCCVMFAVFILWSVYSFLFCLLLVSHFFIFLLP